MSSSDLLDELTKKPQRESAGADSASRFDFQKNWAFREMLKKHIDNEDYLVAFEFHDDVLFFESEEDPAQVDFLQVKTSRNPGPRKLNTLTYRAKNKDSKAKSKNSIIGKMLLNMEGICQSFSIRLVLVSNTVFEFSSVDIKASDLGDKYREKLLIKIKDEFPQYDDSVLENIHFKITSIPVDEIETLIKGEALDLFSKRFGDGHSQNVNSWIRLIRGEIHRKNNFPSNEIKSVNELIEKKCLGKKFIEATLDRIEEQHKNAPDMNLIKQDLMKSGWALGECLKLDKALSLSASDYKDPTNIECIGLCQEIGNFLDGMDISKLELSQLVEDAYDFLNSNNKLPPPYEDKAAAASLIILVYNEKL